MIRLFLRFADRARARRSRAARTIRLEDLNDHQLADIGLTRDRIHSAIKSEVSEIRWRTRH